MALKKGLPLMILVAVLFIMFIGFALNTYIPSPQWSDFCEEKIRIPGTGIEIGDTTECSAEYDLARESHGLKVGIGLIVLGLAVIMFGMKFSKLEPFTNLGLIWGGVLTVIYGVLRFWSYIDSNLQPIIIGAVLVLIIYLGNKFKRLL